MAEQKQDAPLARPAKGGRYVRDPKTNELKQVQKPTQKAVNTDVNKGAK